MNTIKLRLTDGSTIEATHNDIAEIMQKYKGRIVMGTKLTPPRHKFNRS